MTFMSINLIKILGVKSIPIQTVFINVLLH